MTDLEKFEIPRKDWYDEEGRIYKDVIIENLNACEQKILELQKLDAFNIEPPNFNTITYPDTTLDSDERSILNLRSFLNIIPVINYPMEVQVSGAMVKKVSYWDSNYTYQTITNTDLKDSIKEMPYVYVNLDDSTVRCTDSPTVACEGVLIGVYKDNNIVSVLDSPSMSLNVYELLANMPTVSGNASWRPADGAYGVTSKNGYQVYQRCCESMKHGHNETYDIDYEVRK